MRFYGGLMSFGGVRRISDYRNAGGFARGVVFFAAAFFAAVPASSQTINMFPKNYQQLWTRVAIPPSNPLNPADQWHINAKAREIACDGNKGHEWLRFDRELTNFDFKVEWRVTPPPGTTKYNSGVFFRNNRDGSIWHQAQTSPGGGYIFAETPVNGKLTRVNLQKEMTENRVKPAGQWNAYDIHCVGTTCTLAVNGKVVNTLNIAVKRGYVGLEAEGYPVTFRHFHLEELP
jgi:3-keto-disaccharide hydrolase